MLSHKTTIRVRYADTDKMQFVYNGKYLEYFEVGRTELLRSAGLPYSQIEKEGYTIDEAGSIIYDIFNAEKPKTHYAMVRGNLRIGPC